MRFVGIFNREGGAFRTMDMDGFCDQAIAIFLRHGHALECRLVEGGQVVEALEKVATEPGIDAILAGGGDGTISAAAQTAFNHGIALAVLPAGTMNLFARALQIPLDLFEALDVLARGEIGAVDIATANGKPFVHQYGVGIHPKLVRIRETMSYRGRAGKMLASLKAIGSVVARAPRFAAEVRTPKGADTRWATNITISNNLIGEGHVPYADRLDQGVLGVYVAKPMLPATLARLALGVLVGRWKASAEVSEAHATSVSLRFPRRKITHQAVIDGELVALADQVDLCVHPGGLKVVLPALTKSEASIHYCVAGLEPN